MTVNRQVNPKKLRPYDEPPKRRRTLIPDAPDSAATGFLVAAAIWLVVATGLGLLAIGMRLLAFEFSFALPFELSFELDARRVEYAFINATVYGWLTNAGFAAVAFMTPRLTGRSLASEKGLNGALAIWNLSLMGGVALLYVLDLGPHAPLTAFPWFVDGGLATGALIVTGVFLATAATSLRGSYVSLWFAGVALLGLLGLLTVNAGIGLFETFLNLDELPTALGSLFIERAVVVVWLLGITLAILHYIVPRAAGQPLASGGVALLAWATWLVLAPASGLSELRDDSVPFIFTTVGVVATMLLLVPVLLTLGNLVATLQGRLSLLFGTNTASFAVVAAVVLAAWALLDAIGALHGVHLFVNDTDWERGVFVWGAYGAFTLAAFGLAEHAFPRMLRRAWGGGFLSSAELWLAWGGATLAGFALMGGGFAEASLLAQGTAPDAVRDQMLWYRAGAFLAFGMVALSGLAMLANVFLMYTSAEPADYAVPGGSATAAAGH